MEITTLDAFVVYGAVRISEGFQVELFLQQELVDLWPLREGGRSLVEVQKLGCLVAMSQKCSFNLKPERALHVIHHVFPLVGFGFHPTGCSDTEMRI